VGGLFEYVHFMGATAKDVAKYMASEAEGTNFLYQEVIVQRIRSKFGEEFVYFNANGNHAIDKRVLREFRNLTPDLVWDRGNRCWRKRQGYDPDGSRASY